ncbi:MAG: hypothetical protein RL662_1051 [Bacteroidota bacterium]|jgi:hypothetical protein
MKRDWRDSIIIGSLVGGAIIICFVSTRGFNSTQSSNTNTNNTTVTTSPQPNRSNSSESSDLSLERTSEQKITPEQFIKEHYSAINNRLYETTWQHLTPEFQNKAGDFSGYVDWWDSVNKIEIGQVRLIEQSNNKAIVDAKLTFFMKQGTLFHDPKSRIYLIWNDSTNSWLVENKTEENESFKTNESINESEAVSLIEKLYYLLSEKSFTQTVPLYSPELANQFTPGFFGQFERVTVENLQIVSRTENSIDFTGQNTYSWRDGSTQKELRSYTVKNFDVELKITSSQFIKVIKFR